MEPIMTENIKLTLTVNSVIDNLDDAGLPDGDPEINIFTTDGDLSVSDKGMKLSFSEENEGGKTVSTLYLLEESVILHKHGAIESEIAFREGEEYKTVYKVGPYAFDMTVRAKKIRNSLTRVGGELQLIYSMNVGGQDKNVRMKISAKLR